jgi:hypothetical protein
VQSLRTAQIEDRAQIEVHVPLPDFRGYVKNSGGNAYTGGVNQYVWSSRFFGKKHQQQRR